MKRMIGNSTETVNFEGFEVLSNVEMLQVRGGEGTTRTKDRDVFEEETE